MGFHLAFVFRGDGSVGVVWMVVVSGCWYGGGDGGGGDGDGDGGV